MSGPNTFVPSNLVSFLHLEAVTSIVDTGCGNASFTSYLLRGSSPEAVLIGLDLDRDALKRAQPAENLELIQAEASRIPLRSDFADLVICRRLLMNLPAPLEAIREMMRITRPGGLVAAIEPHFLAEHGHSTVPGELDFLRRLLQLTAGGSDLEFGPKTVSLFGQIGLQDVEATVYSPVEVSGDHELPTVHREHSRRRLVDAVEGWRRRLTDKVGQEGYDSMRREARKLDSIRDGQVAAGRYSSVSTFPLWVVKGRKSLEKP